jgi:hypothetical protein
MRLIWIPLTIQLIAGAAAFWTIKAAKWRPVPVDQDRPRSDTPTGILDGIGFGSATFWFGFTPHHIAHFPGHPGWDIPNFALGLVLRFAFGFCLGLFIRRATVATAIAWVASLFIVIGYFVIMADASH